MGEDDEGEEGEEGQGERPIHSCTSKSLLCLRRAPSSWKCLGNLTVFFLLSYRVRLHGRSSWSSASFCALCLRKLRGYRWNLWVASLPFPCCWHRYRILYPDCARHKVRLSTKIRAK